MSSRQDEDRFISYFFGHRKPVRRTFCDVGALDGVRFSNTRALLDAGWTGVVGDCKLKQLREVGEVVEGRRHP